MTGERWSPGIGDPTVAGWVTVAAYFGAALLCAWAGRRRSADRSIWWGICLFLIALGINKQLDLQSLLTQYGRDILKAKGLYEQRGVFQGVFVTAVVVFNVAGSLALTWVMRARDKAVRTALAGSALLLTFIAIRAASFHHVDLFLGSALFGARFNAILELGAIGVIVIGVVQGGSARRP